MAEGQQFPIFITARSDPNQRAFDEFVTSAERAGKRAGEAMGRALSGARDTVAQALSLPRNDMGSLDLNIKQLRDMEREASAVARATREYAEASKAAAIASGENSRARTAEIRAAFELARIEASNLSQLQTKIRVLDQVQNELNQTASATSAVIGKNNELIRSMQEIARAANTVEQSQRNVNALSAPGLDPFRAATNNGATYSALTEMVKQEEAAEKLRIEMDALRRSEVAAAESAKMLAAIYRNTAQEVGRTTKSARDSAAAFEALYREQEQAARAMDDLRRAEVGAAEGARILEATYRGTALEIGRTANSARASAAVFEAAFRQQEQAAAGVSIEIQRLMQQIDPAAAAQMRLEKSTEMVNAALRQQIITQQQATQALDLLNAEYVRNAGASGQMRMGMVQVGQQMQDVAISLYGGQRASVVFAQQIPQLMFALTSLEGSSNKTANKIGQFATLMSGPWSLAVVAGAAALGYLIEKMLSGDEAAEKSKKSTLLLVDALSKQKFGTDEARKAVEDFAKAKRDDREATEKNITRELESAKARYADALAMREQIKAIYELERARAATSTRGAGGGIDPLTVVNDRYGSMIAANEANIATAEKALNELMIMDAGRAAKEAVDPIAKINRQYDDMALAAQQAATGNMKLAASLKETLTQIELKRKADLDAEQARQRNSRTTYNRDAQLEDFGNPLTGSYRLGDGYGVKRGSRTHGGIDYQIRSGSPVYATQSGTVDFAGLTNDGYGNLIKLNHGSGTQTRYAHLSRFAVNSGQSVNKGDIIGYTGGAKGAPGAGNSTGPHLHYEVWVNGKKVDPSKGKFPMDSAKVAEEAQKAATALQDFGSDASEHIKRINEQFDEQPRLIDRAAAATRSLDATIAELTARKPEGWEKMVADAEAAKATIQDALVRPMREMREESERRIEIEQLITAGKEDEAEALQIIYGLERQIGPLRAAQKQDILDQVRYERLVTEELRRRQVVVDYYLDATRSVKQELVAIFSGSGSFKNLGQIFKDLQSKVLVEKLFGKAFDDFDKWVKGQSGLSKSVDYFTEETTEAGDAAGNLATALNKAVKSIGATAQSATLQSKMSGALSGMPPGQVASLFESIKGSYSSAAVPAGAAALAGAANDNDIVVIGGKKNDSLMSLSPGEYFEKMSKVVVDQLLSGMDGIFGTKFFSKLGGVLGGAMNGYLTGGATGGILGGLQGLFGKDSKVGGVFGKGVAGAQTGTIVAGLGKALGIEMSDTGAQIGGAIGSMVPIPGGDIIGAIGGGIIGGIFKENKVSIPAVLGGLLLGGIGGAIIGALLGSTPKFGAAAISSGRVQLSGNESKYKDAASTGADSIQEALKNIAEQLGATVGDYAVSIGVTKGNWNVNPGIVKGRIGTDWQRDTIDFKKDQEGAIRWAISNAIQDGAIMGLRATSQALLRKGNDIEAQVAKVLKFESVFKELRQIKDPVGAAIEELDKWANQMKALFAEAGASAEEYAQLEELYGLKRAEAIKQASEAMTSSLRSLLDELTIGNDALSLRERQSNAIAKYDPLRARVAAGDVTAYNDFADAARALLDIERQMFGSQSGYFDRLAEVTGLTRSAIAGQDALIAGATGGSTPFAANDNVVGVLDTQTGVLQTGFDGLQSQLAAVNQNLGALISLNYGAVNNMGIAFINPAVSYY